MRIKTGLHAYAAILMLFLGMLAMPAFAATCTSRASGNWGSSSTWNNCNSTVPGAGDTAIIANTVTLSATTTVGTVTINSGATLDVSKSNYALNVQGNFTNNGTFTQRTGTVTMSGSAPQVIGGTTSTTFNRLVINNSSSGVGLAANISTVGLTLTKGVVSTGAYTLAYTSSCSATAPAGSSSSFVAGLLKLTFPSGNITCTFPVGDATTGLYAPITVAFVSSGGGTLTGSTSPDTGNAKQTAAGLDTNASANRYWTLTKGTLTSFTSYSATLQFNNPADLDAGATPDSFLVRHYTGGGWITPTVGTTDSTTAQATGITQKGFGDFAVGVMAPSACSAPTDAPKGVTCQCDNFGRSDLNPSTIFGANWFPNSSSGPKGFPQIAIPGYLRLTDAQGNESNSATVPGIFPAAGNYISIEFKHYAYGGGGADGIGVVLSDYSQPPNPGAFGGSLGYAQKSALGVSGFNYGWLGVALDEYGNYSGTSEGTQQMRSGGPGAYAQSVGIRGSGAGSALTVNGTPNYPWIGGALCGATGTWPNTNYPYTNLMPSGCGNTGTTGGSLDNRGSSTPSRGYAYRIIIDARNYTDTQKSTLVSIGRDTSGGSTYSDLVPSFDIYKAMPSQGVVPRNWQITFTGSTGSVTNIHEIGALKICASTMISPTADAVAGSFNAFDSALGNDNVTARKGHIFMKIAGVPFKLKVAALQTPSDNGVATSYTSKSGTVELIDDTFDPNTQTSCNVSATACSNCARPVVQTQNLAFGSSDKGIKLTSDFTINRPYKRLIARIKQTGSDGKTTTACSVDAFSVRPAYYSLSTAVTGSNVKAPAGAFDITATPMDANNTAQTAGGTGSPTLAANAVPNLTLQSWDAGAASGTLHYNDVGYFDLPANAIYDSLYGNGDGEAKDQDAGDCNPGSGSPYVISTNTAPYSTDGAGKYGCDIGSTKLSKIGRFYPHHYEARIGMVEGCSASGFTYMGQEFSMNDGDAGRLTIKALASGRDFDDQALPSYTTGYSTLAAVLLGARDDGALGTDLAGRISPVPTTQTWLPQDWKNGMYQAPAGPYVFARPASATPDATWGPYDNLNIGVTVADPDGAALTAQPTQKTFDLNSRTYLSISGGTTMMRLGLMRIDNAYGSELLPLPVQVRAMYWNGTRFITNTLDNACSPIDKFTLDSWKPGLAKDATSIASSTGTLSNGTGMITLARPAAGTTRGSVVLRSNLSYLPGNGQETFGTYKSKFIFLREMY